MPCDRLILLLGRPFPSDASREEAAGLIPRCSAHMDRVCALAGRNGVSPLIYRNAHSMAGLPADAAERLRTDYYRTLARNLGLLAETRKIVSALREAGVGVMPLKGPLAAELFLGDGGSYPSDDIDILVRPEDLGRTQEVLKGIGYRGFEGESYEALRWATYHLTMGNGRYGVEVHWNLAMRYVTVSPEFWWEDAVVITHEGQDFLQPSPERYLLYLIFRVFAKGFYPLKFFLLPAALAGRLRETLRWEVFWDAARRLKMVRVCAYTLMFCGRELGVAGAADGPSRPVGRYGPFRRLVLSGIFGEGRRPHLRMLLYTLLLDSPADTCRVLLRRLFPSAGEIRLRYGLREGSPKTPVYYVLNPLLMVIRNRGKESKG